MKKILRLFLFTLMFSAISTHTNGSRSLYTDRVINPDGSVTITEFDKYPAGHYTNAKEGAWYGLSSTLLCGVITGIGSRGDSPAAGAICGGGFVLTVMSAVATICFLDQSKKYTPDYRPSCFEADQKEGPYEYHVRNQHTEYNPTALPKNP